MGESVLHKHFNFLKNCEICGKARHDLYEINLDGYPVYVCSGAEANVAKDRWMKHKEMGGPQKEIINDEPMMEGGDIPEDGGE